MVRKCTKNDLDGPKSWLYSSIRLQGEQSRIKEKAKGSPCSGRQNFRGGEIEVENLFLRSEISRKTVIGGNGAPKIDFPSPLEFARPPWGEEKESRCKLGHLITFSYFLANHIKTYKEEIFFER